MARFKDLTGMKFGRLKVLGLSRKVGTGKRDRYYWNCICDCGNSKESRTDSLTSGNVKSCGCLHQEQAKMNIAKAHTHKMSNTRLHGIWRSLKGRCKNPNNQSYSRYGGRGIGVCESWDNSFEAFASWAFDNGYSEELSIDRINNDGDYQPDNCRWANDEEQCRNRHSNINVEYKGRTITLIELSELTGLSQGTMYARYERGDRGDRLVRPIGEERNVPEGSKQHLSKLTEGDVSEIKNFLLRGLPQNQIAKKFNVSPSSINSIAKGKTWKHVK